MWPRKEGKETPQSAPLLARKKMKVAWAHDVVISLSSLCPSAIAALCAGRAVSGAIAIRAYLGGEDPERERPRQIQCGFEGAACELSREPVQSQTPRGLFAWNRLDEFYGDFSYHGGRQSRREESVP